MGRPRKKEKKQIIPDEYLNLQDEELVRMKRIGDAMQSLEKGRIQEVKAQEAARNVIKTDSAVNIFTDVCSKLKNILYGGANKIPAQIVGKEHAEVTQIMFKFIDECLERVHEDLTNKIANLKVGEDDEDDES